MSRFWFIRADSPSRMLRLADVERIADHLRTGGLAVLPTETGYLLAAAVSSLPALRSAFAVKERDVANPMHIACTSFRMAERYAELPDRARILLGAFTPGPLSVVVRQTAALPHELVTKDGTVGVRVPDHPATLQVIAALGVPVTATSLNRSGQQHTAPDSASLASLDWGDHDLVPVVTDPAAVRYGSPSTLVRLVGAELEVLRPGPVRLDDLEKALADAAHAVGWVER